MPDQSWLWGAHPLAAPKTAAPANPYAARFGIAPVGAGNTSFTRGGGAGGRPLVSGNANPYQNPQTLDEYYALNHDQRRAYGDPTGLMQAGWQTLKDQGLGGSKDTYSPFAEGQIGALPDATYGAPPHPYQGPGVNPTNFDPSTWNAANSTGAGGAAPVDTSAGPLANRGGSSSAAGALATAGNPNAGAGGALPPINPGEDSMAYMTRIGMSPADAQAALTMAQQNPGMSFQDIIARLHGGSTGNNANPANPGVSLGNLTSAQGNVNGVPGYTGGGSFNLADWQDPGYQFRLDEGQKLLEGSAAAGGNLLSGSTLKALTNYGQNAASQEYQNAFNRFSGNRAFNYGVDTGDRAFDYLTQTGDRDFNYGVIKDLVGQGQFGAGGAADTNRLLATLLSQLTLSGGQANAANTIGTGNLTMDAITKYLQQQSGQNTLDRLFPQKTA